MRLGRCAALGALALIVLPVSAQQRVPFRNGTPVAPSGLKIPPLPDHPVSYHTAEGQDIRVVVVARGLSTPWSLAFLPDRSMLVTERPGALRIIRDGALDPTPIVGVPKVHVGFLSGLFNVVLDPDFAHNRYVYLSYDKPRGEDAAVLAVARGEWSGTALREVHDIFVADEGTSGNSRLLFGRDGMLYVSIHSPGAAAQDPASDAGKILRLRPDGTVPSDNPFVGKPGYRPEIFTLGHRDPLGLAVSPSTGDIWEVEMGPNGGDELNILHAGANYGWPLVSLGRTYAGPWQSKAFQKEGFEDPVVYWTPSISNVGPGVLYRRQAAKMEGRRVRRRHALRRDPGHRAAAADPVQREYAGAAAGAAARRPASAHS